MKRLFKIDSLYSTPAFQCSDLYIRERIIYSCSICPSVRLSVWAEGHSDLAVGEHSESVGLVNC